MSKTRTVKVELLPKQKEFVLSASKITLFIAGIGSGKSTNEYTYMKCKTCENEISTKSRTGICRKCQGKTNSRKKYSLQKDKILEKNRQWRKKNSEYLKEYEKHRYLDYKKEYNREWRKNNPDKTKASDQKKYHNHKEKIGEDRKEYYQNNKEKIREYKKEWVRKQRLSNPIFNLKSSLRSRLKSFIKGKNKSTKSLELVGCSLEELKAHLESQFLEGMSWENYGLHGWHIDHIRPCASFDLTDLTQQKLCFHFSNLQPLWAKDNLSKGGKYED